MVTTTAVDSVLAFSSVAHTHLQQAEEERMTVKHHTSMAVLCHLKRVFILYFMELVTLLAVETNRYNHWCKDSLHEGPLPQPHVNEAEMSVYLAITLQMGHCLCDQVTNY